MASVKINGTMFKHAFSFEKPIKSATVSGGQNEDFEQICKTRGLFKYKDGDSNFDDGNHLLVQTYQAWCYWRHDIESNINKDTRLIYDNKIYRIDSVRRVGEARQYLQFDLTEAH